MPDYIEHAVPSRLNIKAETNEGTAAAVSGVYQYLPRCGKACNSLFKRTGNEAPLFLFLDPSRTGEPNDDCFVFSNSVAQLEKDEVRPVLARISSTWRPWTMNGKSQVAAKLLVDESWHQLLSCTLTVESEELAMSRCADPSALTNAAKCSQLAILLSCEIPSSVADLGVEERFVPADDVQFFNSHAWAFEAMRRQLPGPNWHKLQIHHHGGEHYYSCAPDRPVLRWGLTEDRKELRPYEDPRGAALYERAMKTRPDPIMIVVKPVEGDGVGSTSMFSLGLDIATLAHRARARLPETLDISYEWRLVTTGEINFKFKPFKLCNTRGIPPFDKDVDMSVDLFPQQLMSLSWMRQQELGVPFTIEEGEEATIETLGWRAEVRATATKTVRGGICVDHPGFGKTITSLALIHSVSCESNASEIQANHKPRAKGFLPHAGTMIVCPLSLVDQWVAEIREKI